MGAFCLVAKSRDLGKEKKSEVELVIVIVTGASGTGKSTLARKIARHYKLKCIHASDILKDLRTKEIKEIKPSKTKMNLGWWESPAGQKYLDERLKNTTFDKKLDRELLRIVKKGKIVLDSRTMPWLSKRGIKILLTASLSVRVKRISKRDRMSAARAKKAIKKKARIERKIYKKLYGFDQEKDLGVFDIIINTDKMDVKEVFGAAKDFLDAYLKYAK